ncbi:hypothetical protein BC830DRAFT_1093691 [Chytriomyces sp. MP71]|nr:hypothetical protein BC830DRAFT_1093691 [Chytriomyces sp. MP71]
MTEKRFTSSATAASGDGAGHLASPAPVLAVNANATAVTVTLPVWLIAASVALLTLGIVLFVRFVVNTRYSRLPPPVALPNTSSLRGTIPLDLRVDLGDHFDAGTDTDALSLLSAHSSLAGFDAHDVLKRVKVFSYLDRHVLSELARSAVTKRVRAGHVVTHTSVSSPADISNPSYADDDAFVLVLEGTVGVFVRGASASSSSSLQDSASVEADVLASSAHAFFNNGIDSGGDSYSDDEIDLGVGIGVDFAQTRQNSNPKYKATTAKHISLKGFHLLSQIRVGGIVSSMFSVLDILTESVLLTDEMDSAESASVSPSSITTTHRANDDSSTMHSFNTASSFVIPSRVESPVQTAALAETFTQTSPTADEDLYSQTPRMHSFLTQQFQEHSTSHADASTSGSTYAPLPPVAPPPSPSKREGAAPGGRTSLPARTVHPHLTAIAITDTKVLVIPGRAFRAIQGKVTAAAALRTNTVGGPVAAVGRGGGAGSVTSASSVASGPFRRHTVGTGGAGVDAHLSTAAHMAQVLVTRFLRVTVYSMERYLGLRDELLNLERKLSAAVVLGVSANANHSNADVSGLGFDPAVLERLRKLCAETRKSAEAASTAAAATTRLSNSTNSFPISSTPKKNGGTSVTVDLDAGGTSDAGITSLKPKRSPQLHHLEMMTAQSLSGGGSGLRKRHVAKQPVLEVDGSESDSSAIGYPVTRAAPASPPVSLGAAGLAKRNTIMGLMTKASNTLLQGLEAPRILRPAGIPVPRDAQVLHAQQIQYRLQGLRSPTATAATPADRYMSLGGAGLVVPGVEEGLIEAIFGGICAGLGADLSPVLPPGASTLVPAGVRLSVGASSRRSSVDSMDSEDAHSIASSSSEYLATGRLSGLQRTARQSGIGEVLVVSLERGDVLVKEGERVLGVWFVLDGILEASVREGKRGGGGADVTPLPKAGRKKGVFLMKGGSLAGYLAAVTGHPSLVTIKAKTDAQVGFLPKSVIDKFVEKYPGIILTLAKKLVRDISSVAYQIDCALDWGHVNAGQMLYRQGDMSDSIFIVLGGRLRSIAEYGYGNGDSISPTGAVTEVEQSAPSPDDESSKFEIFGEFGPGESIGELEVLTESRRPTTVHAIRDTEVCILPKTLFNALAVRHPEMTIQISRMLAARSQGLAVGGMANFNFNPFGVDDITGSSNMLPGNPALLPQQQQLPNSLGGVSSAKNNFNLKTVGIIPVNSLVPIAAFADRLKGALELIGASVALLNNATVVGKIGKHVFSPLGRLKLMSWLAEQEGMHRLVLYVADGGVGSLWTQRCIRQADCILLVGLGDEDPAIGEYERLVLSLKTTARKELILLHNERYCVPGSTAQWLKSRLWIHAHHHVQMPLSAPKILDSNNRKNTLMDLQAHFQRFYSQATGRLLHPNARNAPNAHTGIRSDLARIARRLLNKSIGLALGGGGARGVSHVAIIRAFEEAGIPIDMVGGTSIGSFVSGLYARENDHVSIYGRAKQLAIQLSSKWRQFVDLTYPLTSLFSGHELNRAIWKCFFETQIEDCWLPYFAVTVNITDSRLEVHRSGYMWRYVRASMSLAGYFPPLCDNGKMLVDGGYLNILPVDILSNLGANVAIAIDVSAGNDTSPVTYGDSLSGVWLFFARFIPGLTTSLYGKIPLLPDIQDRLAFAGSVGRLEQARRGEFYLQPPVGNFSAVEFDKFKDIYQIGYKYGKEVVRKWEKDGTLERRFGVVRDKSAFRRGNRRASI